MKLLHMGSFDVANYGDLLFPFVAEHCLPTARWLHASPTGKAMCGDAAPTTSFSRLPDALPEVSGLVVGGGHLIRSGSAGIPEYRELDALGALTYSAFWLVPALLARAHNLPLVWNAPGVPRRFNPDDAALVRWACSCVSYLAVRDGFSKEILIHAGVERERVHVTPDTACSIATVFKKEDLPRPLPHAYAVFHVKERYLDVSYSGLVRAISDIGNATGATPLLVPLGPCHGDIRVLEEIQAIAGSKLLYVSELSSLRLVSAHVAHAEYYCGSSLHGYIATRSYGRPAVLVADEDKAGFRKFTGHLQLTGSADALVKGWRDKAPILAALRQHGESEQRSSREPLDAHWKCILEGLSAPAGKLPPPPMLSSEQRHRIATVARHFGLGTESSSK